MLKNSILILLICVITTTGVFPRPARAIWGIMDISFDPISFVETIWTAITTYAQLIYQKAWDYFKEYVLKIIIEKFKLKVLDLLNEQVVKWVTKGENEAAKFIGNWEGYLFGAYQTGYNSVGGELRLSKMCDQFKDAVIGSNWQYSDQPASQNSLFLDRMNCSLDPLLNQLGTTIQEYQSDFRNGAWTAYAEQKTNLQNTYLGAYFLASDEAIIRGRTKQNASQQQGIASKGFIPVKRCIEDLQPGDAGPPNPNACAEFQITSPAAIFESALDAATQNRFNYIVNADQIVQLVLVVAESFANKLIQTGIDGLFNYGGTGSTPSSGYIDNTTADDCLALDPTGALCEHITGASATSAPTSKANGQPCTQSEECSSLVCGKSGSCIERSTVPTGSGCNSGLECRSNICSSSLKICIVPQSNGAPCAANVECTSGYCSPATNKCADIPPMPGLQGGLGQPCSATAPNCNAGLRCDWVQIKCVPSS